MYKENTYPTKQVEILDISGAGDTFVAAFTQNYIETHNINTALKYANECSSVVVQKRGVTTI